MGKAVRRGNPGAALGPGYAGVIGCDYFGAYRKDNTHEPLVARDAFRTAREGRRSRRARHAANRMAKNQKREYLLPGFIRRGRRDADGKEHGFLNGRTPQSRGRVYPQYQCSHYERHGRSVCKPYALPMKDPN